MGRGGLRFWATVSKTVCPMLSDRCLSVLSCPVCDVGVLWPNSLTDQDETWHDFMRRRGLRFSLIVSEL